MYLHVATLHLFRFNFLFLIRHNAVLMLKFRPKNHLGRIRKTSHLGFNIPVLVSAIPDGDGPTSCEITKTDPVVKDIPMCNTNYDWPLGSLGACDDSYAMIGIITNLGFICGLQKH